MAYCFAPGETVPQGIRRIAAEQIDKAEATLTGRKQRHKAVHQARKGCKKIRALLRLARGGVGGSTYAQENEFFRDAQRRLSAVRDAAVMVETLDKVAKHHPNGAETFGTVRRELVQRCEHAAAQHLNDEGTVETVASLLREARERVPDWPVKHNGFKALRPGLLKVYGDGAKRFAALGDKPTAEDFHDWRKQAKYLSYHLRLLTPVWPGAIGSIADELGQLGDLLGTEHDLAVLKEMLEADTAGFGGESQIAPLVTLIEARRAELQAATGLFGARLYVDKPKAFVGRLERWWDSWRAQPLPLAAE
jgi:CHAD domain-containing protein